MPRHEHRPIMTTGLKLEANGRPVFSNGRFLFSQSRVRGPDFREAFTDSYQQLDLSQRTPENFQEWQKLVKGVVFSQIAEIQHSGIDIDLDAVRERLERTTVEFGGHPQYSSVPRQANLRQPHPTDVYSDVISYNKAATDVHEFLHAASGQVFTVHIDDEGSYTDHVLVGVHRDKPLKAAPGTHYAGWFRWLNEAITVKLTDLILSDLGLSASGKAGSDVDLLNKLIETGIPYSKFLEAYFEEPDLDAQPGNRMPKWHTLQQSIKDEFGPKFLVKIDEIILARYEPGYDWKKIASLLEKNETDKSKIDRFAEAWQEKITVQPT